MSIISKKLDNGAIVSYQDGFQTSDPSGSEAVMDTLTWSQIANKPTTLSGYGIYTVGA